MRSDEEPNFLFEAAVKFDVQLKIYLTFRDRELS